jgi:flagellar hook-associated protein 1 FlgK
MSKRTIQLSQKSLDIATGNMANVLTPGYSRQRIDTHSMSLRSYANWQTRLSRLSLAGQGVNAFGVAQIRNTYIDKRFREMNSFLAEYDRKLPILEEVQTTIDNYENVGMEGKLAQFKSALQKYATNAPTSRELAGIVRNSALDITLMLNSYARDFDKMLEDNVFELGATIDYVNTLFEKVAQLNKAIVKEYKATEFGNIESGRGVSPYGPLELMDQRNMLLDELSGYGNLKIEENVDGSVNVIMGDVTMVNGDKFEHLVMHEFDKFNAAVIFASNGQVPNLRSGEIKAYADLVNGNGPYANSYQSSGYGIPYYRQAMDAFAEAFAGLMNSVNGVTMTDSSRAMFGSSLDVYDVDGNIVERGPITASTIRISDEWMIDNNMTMIGMVRARPEIIFSWFAFTEDPGTNYTFEITLGDVTETITFDGSETDLQDQIDAAFPDGGIIVTSNAGVLTIRAEDLEVALSITEPTGAFEESVSVVPAVWAHAPNLDGNHANALLLALDHTIKFGRALDFEGTPFDYIAFISNRLGQGLNFLEEQQETMSVTTNNLLDSRDAISGVSTDEEGINMLIYQKWYNAAARMMTTLDEALDRIINGMGRVGL